MSVLRGLGFTADGLEARHVWLWLDEVRRGMDHALG